MRVLLCALLIPFASAGAQDGNPRRFMGPQYNGLFKLKVEGKECTLDQFGNTVFCRQFIAEATGFAVDNDSRRTLIATVAHVFTDDRPNVRRDVQRVRIFDVSGRERKTTRVNGQLFRKHTSQDIAVTAIVGRVEPYKLSRARRGDTVFVFGWPKKYVLRRQMRVSGFKAYRDGKGRPFNRLFYSAIGAESTNSGFSGAPVVNTRGQVVGIHHGSFGGHDDATPADVFVDWVRPIATPKLKLVVPAPNPVQKKEQREVPVPMQPEPEVGGVPSGPVAPHVGLTNAPLWQGNPTAYCQQQRQLCVQAWQQWIEQRIAARMPQAISGNDGKAGAPGKSAYQIAVEMGFQGDRRAWLASLRGSDGADGESGSNGSVDIAALAELLATQHADRLRGKQGARGASGEDGNDGQTVSAEQLRPIIVSIVRESMPEPQMLVTVPTPDEMDRMIDAWIVANGAKINARIDARVDQILKSRGNGDLSGVVAATVKRLESRIVPVRIINADGTLFSEAPKRQAFDPIQINLAPPREK